MCPWIRVTLGPGSGGSRALVQVRPHPWVQRQPGRSGKGISPNSPLLEPLQVTAATKLVPIAGRDPQLVQSPGSTHGQGRKPLAEAWALGRDPQLALIARRDPQLALSPGSIQGQGRKPLAEAWALGREPQLAPIALRGPQLAPIARLGLPGSAPTANAASLWPRLGLWAGSPAGSDGPALPPANATSLCLRLGPWAGTPSCLPSRGSTPSQGCKPLAEVRALGRNPQVALIACRGPQLALITCGGPPLAPIFPSDLRFQYPSSNNRSSLRLQPSWLGASPENCYCQITTARQQQFSCLEHLPPGGAAFPVVVYKGTQELSDRVVGSGGLHAGVALLWGLDAISWVCVLQWLREATYQGSGLRGPVRWIGMTAVSRVPKHWMLHKLTSVLAPQPSSGPHKLRECLPLIIFLRNRLKYALSGVLKLFKQGASSLSLRPLEGDEVKKIFMQRFIKIDGKVRTDITYPDGFMDVISIDKTAENFRLICDTKGHFAVHCITPEEAKHKLCKVRKIFVGTKGIPHLLTHDACTIHYSDPLIKNFETGRITDFIKFDTRNPCIVTGGANLGRIGVITNRERHPGSFDVVHVKDANGNIFATQLSNIFVIGKGNKPWISLPRGKGIHLTIAEERGKRLAAKQSTVLRLSTAPGHVALVRKVAGIGPGGARPDMGSYPTRWAQQHQQVGHDMQQGSGPQTGGEGNQEGKALRQTEP
ncbi:hypothetical protein QTO34_000445 [Cnephaeus nilssonii]|uniref:40S ribosomal protein S4 n=1 Tax=Cnephaeus nilssonii TaxID=3371016 RepID=A0AA40LWK2_CNENI|nr:hypothetical protein QTO34_000445 [Eptesicus nilssonii]